jgi:hypothetical protein
MNKRFLAVLLGLAAALASGQNAQKVIAVDTEVYDLVRAVYIEQGLGLPSQARPWSVEELEYHLARVVESRLSAAGRGATRRIRELVAPAPAYVEAGGLAFAAGLTASLEAYAHIGELPDPDVGSRDDIVLPDDDVWEHGFKERLPLLQVPLEVWLFNALYVDLTIDIRQEPRVSIDEPDTPTNVITDVYDVYAHAPFRTFTAAGGPHWAVQFGRDTLDWGNGVGGNLMLSEAAGYLDFVRATTWWRAFKWTTVYAGLEPWLTTDELSRDPEGADGPDLYKAFFAHRFEWRILDRIGVGFTEGMIFGRKYPDISYFNPMMAFHNWFENKITNINLAIEAEWTPLAGLAVYGQYVLDQWQTPVETSTYPNASDEPNSYGFLLGVQAVRPAGPGWIEVGVEWIHSNPWLYTQRFGSPLLSYTVRRRITAEHRYLLDRPLGWEYGPDADSKTLTIAYRVPGSWTAGLAAELRARGSLSIADLYPDFDNPSPTGPYVDPGSETTPTGPHPERRFVLTTWGDVRVLPRVSLGGSAAWVHIDNAYGEDVATIDDAQITAFVTFTY